MAEHCDLSNFHYMSPNETGSIPYDEVDLIQSFRSWAFKYPFEEYEDLFLKCLKPGLVFGLNTKNKYVVSEDRSLIKHAKERIRVPSPKHQPRHIMRY